jgi:hypothetical protein
MTFYLGLNKGQVNEKAIFYANMSAYTLGMTTDGFLLDIIRKARGEGIDTPRPFLLHGY